MGTRPAPGPPVRLGPLLRWCFVSRPRVGGLRVRREEAGVPCAATRATGGWVKDNNGVTDALELVFAQQASAPGARRAQLGEPSEENEWCVKSGRRTGPETSPRGRALVLGSTLRATYAPVHRHAQPLCCYRAMAALLPLHSCEGAGLSPWGGTSQRGRVSKAPLACWLLSFRARGSYSREVGVRGYAVRRAARA
jgi:hypothetical protein